MSGILLLLLLAGAHSVKPACTAELRSSLWPDKAARDSRTPIEMCVRKHGSYRWQPLTVDISQLRAAAKLRHQ